MANCILDVAPTAPHTPEYQLDPQARQAILARSSLSKQNILIENQRKTFFQQNGDYFGLIDSKNNDSA